MDLAATVSQSLTPEQRIDFPSSMRVPDSETRKILADELKKYPDDANLRFEVSKKYPDLLDQPRTMDLSSTIDAALKSAPVTAPAKPAQTEAQRLKAIPGQIVDEMTAPGRATADVLANQVTGIGSSIVGGWRGLAELARGGSLEDAANAVHQTTQAGTYQPAAGSPGATAMKVVESPANPLNWIPMGATKAGEATTDVTGSPAAGAAVTTLVNAAPLVLIKGGKGATAGEKVVGSSSIANEAPRAVTAESPNYDIPTVMRQKQTVPLREVANPPLELAPNEPRKAGGSPTIDKAEQAPKFVEAAPAPEGKTLPPTEQAKRAQVLARVGVEDVRKSALEGDAKAAATDYQTSKLDNAAGTHLKEVLDSERQALTTHAEKIITDAGGTVGTDAHALETRGHTILQPLEAFRQFFKDKTDSLYATARARGGDQPLAFDQFKSALAKDSDFAQSGAGDLRKGIESRIRELKLAENEGQTLGTVKQAEALRTYLGEQWTPQTNGLVRRLKEALDNDVTSFAGEDVFKQARAIHAMKQTIFSDPKGISSILDSEGINRKVPVEKIADTISALPNAQFEHIVKTLKSVPPELKASADAALSEIKAQLANRLIDQAKSRQGQWGARDVTAYLNKNAVKFDKVFTPEEMAKIGDLNDAGQILRQDQSYPGAAVQEHNLVKRGAMHALRSIGSGVGAFVGGPFGAAVGGAMGDAAAGRFSEAASLKAAQKRTTKLSEFPK